MNSKQGSREMYYNKPNNGGMVYNI